MLAPDVGAQRVFASQSGFVYRFFGQRSGNVRATPGPGCVLDDTSTDDPAVTCSAAAVSRIRFDMGDGNDRVDWNGEEGSPLPASELIIGGSGNDVLNGNFRSRRSVISGGSGNDNIGDATVGRGGPGNDLMRGRYGSASTIYGQGGRDALRGGAGTRTGNGPTIWEGRMRIFGGPGNDDVSGGRYADLVNGEAGDDQVTGGQGRDTLVGESGNDTMLSDDRIIPGARRVRDKVGCGAGRDRVFADRLDRLAGCEKVRRRG
jgi:Ca2+-binding RTX toxin-like protein